MPDEPHIPLAGLFPELSHFPDRAARDAAFSSAKLRVIRAKRRWILLVAAMSGVGLAIALLGLGLKIVFGTNVAWLGSFAGPLTLLVWVWVANIAFRRPIQRDLREQLVARGVPICLACGYDLRGNTSGRCPECGSPPSRDGRSQF